MTVRLRRRRRRLAISAPSLVVIEPRRHRPVRQLSRWSRMGPPVGVATAALGALHLTEPSWFATPVGALFPAHRRSWTYVIGSIYLALGAAFWFPRSRRAAVIGSAGVVGAMIGRASRPRPGPARVERDVVDESPG